MSDATLAAAAVPARPWRSRPWTWVFFAYAAALFIGTHWPALVIPMDIVKRPDLIAHLTIFSIWTVLFFLSGLVGARTVRVALLCGAIGVVYAAIDESSQAIPFVRRCAAFDDYFCDVGGVVLGTIISLVIAVRVGKRPAPAA